MNGIRQPVRRPAVTGHARPPQGRRGRWIGRRQRRRLGFRFNAPHRPPCPTSSGRTLSALTGVSRDAATGNRIGPDCRRCVVPDRLRVANGSATCSCARFLGRIASRLNVLDSAQWLWEGKQGSGIARTGSRPRRRLEDYPDFAVAAPRDPWFLESGRCMEPIVLVVTVVSLIWLATGLGRERRSTHVAPRPGDFRR